MVRRILLQLFVGLLVAGVLLATAQEKPVKKAEVPKAVLEAFQKAYPKATIKGFAKETENNETIYEVENVEGKIHRDVTYKADGELVTLEESLPYEQAPAVIRDFIAKEFPKAKINTCEKVVKGSVTRYELLVSSGGKETEIVFDADGTVVEREQK